MQVSRLTRIVRLSVPLVVLLALVVVLGWGTSCRSSRPAAVPADQAHLQQAQSGIVYQAETRTEPRPLRLHHLTIDLQNPALDLAAVMAEPPAAGTPGDALLTPPVKLAEDHGLLAAVNANAFGGLPDAQGKVSDHWTEKQPVTVLGLVADNDVVRHAPQPGYGSFWLDRKGKPHIGVPTDVADIHAGVSGFELLVVDGALLARQGGPLHPRTAVGIDATGRYLHLVVVDGRQPGYSEGMSSVELAAYMKSLGCVGALNLDGGGSSIMLTGPDATKLAPVNKVSSVVLGVHLQRPLPVMLGVRLKPLPPAPTPPRAATAP